MSAAALVLFVVYLAVGFVVRTWLPVASDRRQLGPRHLGTSGESGVAGGSRFRRCAPRRSPRTGAALAGLKPVAWLEGPGLAWAGLVVAATGIAGTLVTQLGMGSSWRIGVDETERTDLVTRGPFAVVRNPIFTVVALTGAGLVLMATNVVALAGFAMLLLALQLQVRVVEEPYLLRTHGARYATYAARVGRFVPGVGRLTSQTEASAGTGSA